MHIVAIYSNMTHFHVGHFDDVIARSNRDTDDSKLTGAWKNGHIQNGLHTNC